MTEIVAQHLAVPPPSLHQKVPTILPDVEQVVMTALAKDPKSRFGSVHAFANALEQAWQREQAHGTAPTVLWTTLIPPAPPTRETPPSGLAPTLPASAPPTSPDVPSVSSSAQPVVPSKPSTPKSGASRGRTILLIGVVLLINEERERAGHLFEMSSEIPGTMARRAREALNVRLVDGSRGFIYNADPNDLIHFLSWGTRPSRNFEH